MEFKLLFTHGRGFMSRFVAWWVRSCLSHTVGAFTILRSPVIMESGEKGVALVPAKHFLSNNTVEAVVRPISGQLSTKEGIEEHVSWLIDQYGADSYDWMAAGSVGIFNRMRWLWNVVGGWLKKRWGKNAVHCTELWVNLLKHAQYHAVDHMDAELSDPLRLLRALQADPHWIVEGINPAVKKEVDRKDG